MRGDGLVRCCLALAGAFTLAACKREPPPGPTPLASAIAGLDGPGPLEAQIVTTEGTVRCTLDEAKTPRSVGMFVGLARRHFYDGLSVFRATDGVMFQSGCPNGDGTGTPGYRIELEPHADDEARLSRAGVLLLASYHAPPNREDPAPPPPGQVIGSQFVIALGDMHHLAGHVTVLGACVDLPTVRAITHAAATKPRAVSVTRITIARRAIGE